MSKYLSCFVFVLLNIGVSFSQGELIGDGLVSNLDLKIDTTIFNGQKGMFYYNTTDQSIVMIAFLAPQEYEIALKQLLEKENEKREIQVLSTEKNLFEGVQSLFQKGTIEKKGVKLFTYSYLVEYSKNQTFFLFGCTKSNEDRHVKAFYEAAESLVKRVSVGH